MDHKEVYKRLRTNEALEEDLILANARILELENYIKEAIVLLEASESPFYKGIERLKKYK